MSARHSLRRHAIYGCRADDDRAGRRGRAIGPAARSARGSGPIVIWRIGQRRLLLSTSGRALFGTRVLRRARGGVGTDLPGVLPGTGARGLLEMLRARKPEPLITPGARTEAEWVESGRRVFDEMDVPTFRSINPQIIAMARSAEEFARRGGHAQKDGRVLGVRWVPTSKGLSLSVSDCGGCHTRVMPDGSLLNGAPFNAPLNGVLGAGRRGTALFFPGDSPPSPAGGVHGPVDSRRHPRRHEVDDEAEAALFGSVPTGAFARFNGSPYCITKVPDLIGINVRATSITPAHIVSAARRT